MPAPRPVALLAAGILLLAACGTDTDPGGSPGATTVHPDGVAASGAEDVPSALDDPDDDAHPEPLIDTADLCSGGPPPDGIPSIDDPVYLDAGDVEFLEPREPVLVLDIDDDVRVFPIQIMTWHEIVNDTVAGVPVAVTYCPLCNSAVAYDRRVDDLVLEFGVSGMLYNSAMVMYDRQTESLWSHFTAEAVVGYLTGTELETYPLSLVAWEEALDRDPDALVLSRDTGFDRRYGDNPYVGYDDIDDPPFLFDGDGDGRLPAKARVVGIEVDGAAVAVRHDVLVEERVRTVEVGGTALVVWLLPGTASALEASTVHGGRDVGATGVFHPEVDGETLTFDPVDGGFEDRETGSRWDVFGRAVDGPLEGERLEQVDHLDTFWFAWAAFQPDTDLVPAVGDAS